MKKQFINTTLSNYIIVVGSAVAREALGEKCPCTEIPVEFYVYKKKASWIEPSKNNRINFIYDIRQGNDGSHTLFFDLHERYLVFAVNIGKADCLPKKTIIKHLIKELIKFANPIEQFKRDMREALPNVNFSTDDKAIADIFDQYMSDPRIELSEQLEQAFDEVIIEMGQA